MQICQSGRTGEGGDGGRGERRRQGGDPSSRSHETFKMEENGYTYHIQYREYILALVLHCSGREQRKCIETLNIYVCSFCMNLSDIFLKKRKPASLVSQSYNKPSLFCVWLLRNFPLSRRPVLLRPREREAGEKFKIRIYLHSEERKRGKERRERKDFFFSSSPLQ